MILGTRGTPKHSHGECDCCLSHFWFLCVAFRSVNKQKKWNQLHPLMGGVSPARPQGRPTLDWAKIQSVLGRCIDDAAQRGDGILSDVYYPAVLRQYRRTPNAQWVNCQSEPLERKVLLGLQCLWCAVPHQELEAYAAAPRPEHYINFYETFRQRMRDTTSGLYGPYMMKVGLDLLVVCRCVHSHHVVRWPTECHGYMEALRYIFGPTQLTQEFRLKALQWLHREFGDACGGG